jgi:hypothetical protein
MLSQSRSPTSRAVANALHVFAVLALVLLARLLLKDLVPATLGTPGVPPAWLAETLPWMLGALFLAPLWGTSPEQAPAHREG